MKTFITGGAGFIGSHIVDYLLAKGDTLTVYDNFSNGKEAFLAHHQSNSCLAIVRADVLDYPTLLQSIRGHDRVVHLAANADIAASASSTELDLRQTVLATYNILEAMRNAGVKQIIYSSGSGVYGDIGETAPTELYAPLLPVSMYGATKLGAEALISAFAHLFDFKAWIFRFANVIGSRQTHGVGYDFINKLRKDPTRLEILGNGWQSKSYIHVDDVIAAIFCAATHAENSPVSTFNVATGDYITVRRIAEIVVDEMVLPNASLHYGDTPIGWKGDVPVVRLDDSKIRALGWRQQYGAEAAMRRSIQQMLEQQ